MFHTDIKIKTVHEGAVNLNKIFYFLPTTIPLYFNLACALTIPRDPQDRLKETGAAIYLMVKIQLIEQTQKKKK